MLQVCNDENPWEKFQREKWLIILVTGNYSTKLISQDHQSQQQNALRLGAPRLNPVGIVTEQSSNV